MYQKSEVSVLPYFGQSTRIFPSLYKADKLILSMKSDNKKVYQRSPIFTYLDTNDACKRQSSFHSISWQK